MRVEIEMKNGRRTKVQPIIAQHLQSRGLATVIGEMPAEGAYQTRAMAPQTSRGAATKPEPEVELDSQGVEWDAAVHTSTKLKNSDGTWRKKPGRPTSDPA